MGKERKTRTIRNPTADLVGKRVLVVRTDTPDDHLQECSVMEFTTGGRVKIKWATNRSTWLEATQLEVVEVLEEKPSVSNEG